MITLLRLLLTIVPAAVLFYARRFLPAGMEIGSVKIGAVPLADLLAAAVIALLIWFLITPPVCRFVQNLHFKLSTQRKIRQQIRKQQRFLLIHRHPPSGQDMRAPPPA